MNDSQKRRTRPRWGRLAIVIGAASGVFVGMAGPVSASVALNGEGSSFAAPEVSQWAQDTAKAPYNLNVNYTSQSSGDGRYQFANKTVDFAVSDIPYQAPQFDTAQPNFPFMYVPVTAGGLAFMYHLNGFSGTLQLSSYSACAIFTGGVTHWNDPIVQADNPGASLPSTAIHPVIRSDLAGTNFVFQEWCIHEQPNLWASFVNSSTVRSYPGQVGDLSPNQPRSDWPLFPNAVSQSSSASAADTVSGVNDDGYITAVETAYALQRHFPVASVKNSTGVYNQPGALNVASALAYATQQANGTHVLNFDGIGKYVYNPSTYSYLLTPTNVTSSSPAGWGPAKGAVLSQFVDYALTLGQQKAPEIGYASLGLSLEQYGVNAVKADVPGAVLPTAAEQSAYACGDFTPAEVQAGATAPVCGVTNTAANLPAGSVGTPGASGHAASGASTAAGRSGSGSAVDPGVALSGAPGLAFTGANPVPVLALGVAVFGIGFAIRRRLLRKVSLVERGWGQAP